MSAEVTIRIFSRPLTVGDNPNSSAYEPPLRQYAGTLCEMLVKWRNDSEVKENNTTPYTRRFLW
jgi:hypothetical protein